MSAVELSAITGLPEPKAAALLAAHGGDANAALSAHLDALDASGGGGDPAPAGNGASSPPPREDISATDKLFAKAREAGPRKEAAAAAASAFVPFGGRGRSLNKAAAGNGKAGDVLE